VRDRERADLYAAVSIASELSAAMSGKNQLCFTVFSSSMVTPEGTTAHMTDFFRPIDDTGDAEELWVRSLMTFSSLPLSVRPPRSLLSIGLMKRKLNKWKTSRRTSRMSSRSKLDPSKV
jgi:hypothetical protein